MKKDFSSMSPLPFKDPYEISSFTQEHPLGVVVESTTTARTGLYVDSLDSFESNQRYDVALGPDDRVDNQLEPRDDDHDHGEAKTNNVGSSNELDNHAEGIDERSHPDESHQSSNETDDEEDEWTIRRRLLERDRVERQLSRERLRRERHERRAQRTTHGSLRRRRRPARRPRHVDSRGQRANQRHARLSRFVDRRPDAVPDRRPRAVSSDDQPRVDDQHSHVATAPQQLKRPFATRAQGAAMALYFALLPYVVYSKWRQIDNDTDSLLVHTILVVLILFWFASLCQVILNVRRLRKGRRVNSGASAWLAGLVVA